MDRADRSSPAARVPRTCLDPLPGVPRSARAGIGDIPGHRASSADSSTPPATVPGSPVAHQRETAERRNGRTRGQGAAEQIHAGLARRWFAGIRISATSSLTSGRLTGAGYLPRPAGAAIPGSAIVGSTRRNQSALIWSSVEPGGGPGSRVRWRRIQVGLKILIDGDPAMIDRTDGEARQNKPSIRRDAQPPGGLRVKTWKSGDSVRRDVVTTSIRYLPGRRLALHGARQLRATPPARQRSATAAVAEGRHRHRDAVERRAAAGVRAAAARRS